MAHCSGSNRRSEKTHGQQHLELRRNTPNRGEDNGNGGRRCSRKSLAHSSQFSTWHQHLLPQRTLQHQNPSGFPKHQRRSKADGTLEFCCSASLDEYERHASRCLIVGVGMKIHGDVTCYTIFAVKQNFSLREQCSSQHCSRIT